MHDTSLLGEHPSPETMVGVVQQAAQHACHSVLRGTVCDAQQQLTYLVLCSSHSSRVSLCSCCARNWHSTCLAFEASSWGQLLLLLVLSVATQRHT